MADQEEWLTLRACALRVTGRDLPHITVSRWAKYGVYGYKLDWKWIGGRRYTTVKLMEQFIASLSESKFTNGYK